jgi:hypothetical protein
MTKLIYSNNIEKLTEDGFEFTPDSSEIIKYNGTSAAITIPDSVVIIDDNAFANNKTITTIIFNIGSNLTTIGINAFSGCTQLTSINLPGKIDFIGSSAFQGCTSLKSINIPPSISIINENTFSGCTSLINITMLPNVKTINPYAFQNCEALTSITIPYTVTKIEAYGFKGCTSLNEIIFEGNVPSFGEQAFLNIANVINTKYNSWDNDDKQKFREHTNAGRTINFYDIESLPISTNGIKKISNRTFSISREKILVLDYDVNKCIAIIMDYLYPSPLKVPEFLNIQSQEYLYIYILKPIDLSYSNFESVGGQNDMREVIFKFDSESDPAIKKLKEIDISKLKEDIDKLKPKPIAGLTISDDGFTITGYTGTSTEITIPDEIKIIGNNAFDGQEQITKINFNIGSQLTTISSYAFYNCNNLTSINIPFSVSIIDEYAFAFCTLLKSINISYKVNTIGISAFTSCKSLTSITIPFSVTTIDAFAFMSCTSLNEIIFEGQLPTIYDAVFVDIARSFTVKYWNTINKQNIIDSSTEKSVITFIDISSIPILPNGIKKISDRAFSISKEKILVLNSDIDQCIAIIKKYLYPSGVNDVKYQSKPYLYINMLNPIEQFYPQIESFDSPYDSITELIFKFYSESDPAIGKLENINKLEDFLKLPLKKLNYILIAIIILLIMYILYMVIFKRVFI